MPANLRRRDPEKEEKRIKEEKKADSPMKPKSILK